MLLGKVIGTVTPCVVYEGLEGVPMLLVQPLDKHQNPDGIPIVAADSTRMAAPGELIYYESVREAALALDPWFVPVNDAIIGIVDNVHLLDFPTSSHEVGEEDS
jgi:ethanolamine utilization protein EutN